MAAHLNRTGRAVVMPNYDGDSGTKIARECVQDSAEALAKDVCALREEIEQLTQRLGPVLNPRPELPGTAKGGPEAPAPALRQTLNSTRNNLNECRERVRGLLDGLDL